MRRASKGSHQFTWRNGPRRGAGGNSNGNGGGGGGGYSDRKPLVLSTYLDAQEHLPYADDSAAVTPMSEDYGAIAVPPYSNRMGMMSHVVICVSFEGNRLRMMGPFQMLFLLFCRGLNRVEEASFIRLACREVRWEKEPCIVPHRLFTVTRRSLVTCGGGNGVVTSLISGNGPSSFGIVPDGCSGKGPNS